MANSFVPFFAACLLTPFFVNAATSLDPSGTFSTVTIDDTGDVLTMSATFTLDALPSLSPDPTPPADPGRKDVVHMGFYDSANTNFGYYVELDLTRYDYDSNPSNPRLKLFKDDTNGTALSGGVGDQIGADNPLSAGYWETSALGTGGALESLFTGDEYTLTFSLSDNGTSVDIDTSLSKSAQTPEVISFTDVSPLTAFDSWAFEDLTAGASYSGSSAVNGSITDSVSVPDFGSPIPEPSSSLLALLGSSLILFVRRRKA